MYKRQVSAYCNAGFDVLGDLASGGSLCGYVDDPVVNLTIMALITIGGLGFAVWGDIRKNRRFSRLSVYSRLVVAISPVSYTHLSRRRAAGRTA